MRLRPLAVALALLGAWSAVAGAGTGAAQTQTLVRSAPEFLDALTRQNASVIELAGPVTVTREDVAAVEGLPALVPPNTTLYLRGGGRWSRAGQGLQGPPTGPAAGTAAAASRLPRRRPLNAPPAPFVAGTDGPTPLSFGDQPFIIHAQGGATVVLEGLAVSGAPGHACMCPPCVPASQQRGEPALRKHLHAVPPPWLVTCAGLNPPPGSYSSPTSMGALMVWPAVGGDVGSSVRAPAPRSRPRHYSGGRPMRRPLMRSRLPAPACPQFVFNNTTIHLVHEACTEAAVAQTIDTSQRVSTGRNAALPDAGTQIPTARLPPCLRACRPTARLPPCPAPAADRAQRGHARKRNNGHLHQPGLPLPSRQHHHRRPT